MDLLVNRMYVFLSILSLGIELVKINNLPLGERQTRLESQKFKRKRTEVIVYAFFFNFLSCFKWGIKFFLANCTYVAALESEEGVRKRGEEKDKGVQRERG